MLQINDPDPYIWIVSRIVCRTIIRPIYNNLMHGKAQR